MRYTVGELITKLRQYDPDMIVVVDARDFDYPNEAMQMNFCETTHFDPIEHHLAGYGYVTDEPGLEQNALHIGVST